MKRTKTNWTKIQSCWKRMTMTMMNCGLMMSYCCFWSCWSCYCCLTSCCCCCSMKMTKMSCYYSSCYLMSYLTNTNWKKRTSASLKMRNCCLTSLRRMRKMNLNWTKRQSRKQKNQVCPSTPLHPFSSYKCGCCLRIHPRLCTSQR